MPRRPPARSPRAGPGEERGAAGAGGGRQVAPLPPRRGGSGRAAAGLGEGEGMGGVPSPEAVTVA